jgi:hypothetical protein
MVTDLLVCAGFAMGLCMLVFMSCESWFFIGMNGLYGL